MYKIDTVKPGDLIKADFIDSLISALLDLDARVTKLEAGVATGVNVFDVSPNPVTVQGLLTVVGTNFSVPTNLNVVTLGSTTITIFKDLGTSTSFQFEVPSIPNLDPNGTTMPLVITNAQGQQGSRMVTVRPYVQAPAGRILASTATPSVTGTLASLQTLTYSFTLTAQVSLDAAYTATVSSSNPAFTPSFLVNGQSAGPSTSFQMSASGTQPLVVQVAVGSNVANGTSANITVVVNCTTPNNNVQALNQTVVSNLTVGSPIPTPATGAAIALTSPVTTSGTVVFNRPAAGQTTTKTMIFNVLQSVAGTTTGAVSMLDPTGKPASGWTTTTPTSGITLGNGPGSYSIWTSWSAASNAIASATLQVTVQLGTNTFTYAQPVAVTG